MYCTIRYLVINVAGLFDTYSEDIVCYAHTGNDISLIGRHVELSLDVLG